MQTILNGAIEKAMMLQTTSQIRHNWKDMKYKNKRDSNGHVKKQEKIGENLKYIVYYNCNKKGHTRRNLY